MSLSKILVIYTGGTFGMKPDESGVLAPAADDLSRELAKFPDLCARERDENGKHFLNFPRDSRFPSKNIWYTVEPLPQLLDSSSLSPESWNDLARLVEQHYAEYDGFVIIHGTDTMAFTASALSFMLEELGKPVILTGAQIPIFEPRSDGRNNLANSLITAANFPSAEVMLCFDNAIFRGNRCTKLTPTRFHAFDSPNFPPLAVLESATDKFPEPKVPSSNQALVVHAGLRSNVGILRLYPGISPETVRAFLGSGLSGVVLQSFGAGNAPENEGLRKALREKPKNVIIVMNVSQCPLGSVSSSYAAGQALQEAGVISGEDMTTETAFTKLAYVLSKTEWTLAQKQEKMRENLKGELTVDTLWRQLMELELPRC